MKLYVWLVVFYIPSTSRSFRDSNPIYCPLRMTYSPGFIPSPPGIEPRVDAWQSITQPLRHASSSVKLYLKRFSIYLSLITHDSGFLLDYFNASVNRAASIYSYTWITECGMWSCLKTYLVFLLVMDDLLVSAVAL